MATYEMAAMPGHFAVDAHGRSMVVAITARPYARERVEAADLGELRAAVAEFGKGTLAGTGGASFLVSVTVARGSRKHRGFDQANERDGLGEQAFMRTAPMVDHADPGLMASAAVRIVDAA